jgi:hypothetical protein
MHLLNVMMMFAGKDPFEVTGILDTLEYQSHLYRLYTYFELVALRLVSSRAEDYLFL